MAEFHPCHGPLNHQTTAGGLPHKATDPRDVFPGDGRGKNGLAAEWKLLAWRRPYYRHHPPVSVCHWDLSWPWPPWIPSTGNALDIADRTCTYIVVGRCALPHPGVFSRHEHAETSVGLGRCRVCCPRCPWRHGGPVADCWRCAPGTTSIYHVHGRHWDSRRVTGDRAIAQEGKSLRRQDSAKSAKAWLRLGARVAGRRRVQGLARCRRRGRR